MQSRPLSSTSDTHIQLLIGQLHLYVRQTSLNHHFKLSSWFRPILLLMAFSIPVDGSSIRWWNYLCTKPWNHLHFFLPYSTSNPSRNSIDSTFLIDPQYSPFPLLPWSEPPSSLTLLTAVAFPWVFLLYLCSLVIWVNRLIVWHARSWYFSAFHFILKTRVLTFKALYMVWLPPDRVPHLISWVWI